MSLESVWIQENVDAIQKLEKRVGEIESQIYLITEILAKIREVCDANAVGSMST